MMFQPVLPWAILAVVIGALVLARLVALRQVLWSAGQPAGPRDPAVERRDSVRAVADRCGYPPCASRQRNPKGRNSGARGKSQRVPGRRSIGCLRCRGLRHRGIGKPRIAGMRDDIAAVIKQYPAARYALVGFASKAVLEWPLSEDVWSLRPTIAALSAYPSGPDARFDVNIAAAGTVLRYQLIQAAQLYPGSRNVVLYFGSGAPGSRAPQGDFDLTRGLVDGGAVLSYGRSEAIGEAELRQVAGQLAVPYVHRDAAAPFRPDLPDMPNGTGVRSADVERIELYWLPALLAAGLLLTEIYLSVREYRRGRIARGTCGHDRQTGTPAAATAAADLLRADHRRRPAGRRQADIGCSGG